MITPFVGHFVKSKERREKSPWDNGRDPFNQNSNRSDREKWTTSKGGPVFSKLFRLDRTDPLSFGPKFPEILVEWIAPNVSFDINFKENKIFKYVQMTLPKKKFLNVSFL